MFTSWAVKPWRWQIRPLQIFSLALTATYHQLPRNLFEVDIRDVLLHSFMRMTNVSRAPDTSAKHFVANAAVSKADNVPSMV